MADEKTVLTVETKRWLRKHGNESAATPKSPQALLMSQRRKLTNIFRKIDRDGSGSIDTQELRHGLKIVGMNPNLTNKFFPAADSNKDRLIDLDEFCNVFTSGAAAGDYESLQDEMNDQQVIQKLIRFAALYDRAENLKTVKKTVKDDGFVNGQVWMDIFNSYYIPDIDGSSPVVSSRKRAKENAKLKLEAKQQENFFQSLQRCGRHRKKHGPPLVKPTKPPSSWGRPSPASALKTSAALQLQSSAQSSAMVSAAAAASSSRAQVDRRRISTQERPDVLILSDVGSPKKGKGRSSPNKGGTSGRSSPSNRSKQPPGMGWTAGMSKRKCNFRRAPKGKPFVDTPVKSMADRGGGS